MEQAEKLKSREKLKPLNGGKDGGGCGESGDKVVMIRWNESFKHSDGLTDKGTFVILVSLSSLSFPLGIYPVLKLSKCKVYQFKHLKAFPKPHSPNVEYT